MPRARWAGTSKPKADKRSGSRLVPPAIRAQIRAGAPKLRRWCRADAGDDRRVGRAQSSCGVKIAWSLPRNQLVVVVSKSSDSEISHAARSHLVVPDVAMGTLRGCRRGNHAKLWLEKEGLWTEVERARGVASQDVAQRPPARRSGEHGRTPRPESIIEPTPRRSQAVRADEVPLDRAPTISYVAAASRRRRECHCPALPRLSDGARPARIFTRHGFVL